MATLKQWASYYARCRHRSHRLRQRCLRGMTYQYKCARHDYRCFDHRNGYPEGI